MAIESVSISVGKETPFRVDELYKKNGGTFEIVGNGVVICQMYINELSQGETEMFHNSNIKLRYHGNSHDGRAVMYVDTAIGLNEVPFDIKLYKDGRVQELFNEPVPMFVFILVNSSNHRVAGIRQVAIGAALKEKLFGFWQSMLESPISHEELMIWYEKDILPYSPALMAKNSWLIGIVKGGFSVENLVFMGDATVEKK